MVGLGYSFTVLKCVAVSQSFSIIYIVVVQFLTSAHVHKEQKKLVFGLVL